MVAAAEVEPLQAAEPGRETRLHHRQGAGQGRQVLFAQGVEVQAAEARQVLAGELGAGDAQARMGGAGIVQGMPALAVLRVDAQAEAQPRPPRPRRLDQGLEAVPLAEGVEEDVIGEVEDPFQFLRTVSRGETVDLAAKVLPPQPGLVEAAGADPLEGAHDQGRQGEEGEGLEGQQDPGPGFPLDPVEDPQIGGDARLVHDIAGAGDPSRVETREALAIGPG